MNVLQERLGERIDRIGERRDAFRADGSTSRMSSMLLPASSAVAADSPVMLPPGRARLAISPVPSGSPAGAITIGISVVARLAACTAGVSEATIMSTLRSTSSAASCGSRARVPSAVRSSSAMVCRSM